MDVEKQRPGGIGDVGCMHAAAGEAPQQKGIDRSEGKLAALGGGPRAGYVIEEPGNLAAGEIRIEEEARARRDQGLEAIRGETAAILRGAAVLPDNRVVDG